MKQINEPPRKISVLAKTDVLVVGSGPAGLSAALAASGEGVKTLLVERFGCFGGNITQAMVGTISWYRSEKTIDAGGVGTEFEDRAKAMGAGDIPQNSTILGYWDALTKAGEALNINVAHTVGIDSTDVWDLTKAEMNGRQKVMWAVAALKKYTPGFQDARLRSFNSSLGIRESRKIIGHYILTDHDVKNEARFDDSVGIFPEFLDAYGVVTIPTTGRYFQVPYGILLPQKVENLLVAGRCVSANKIAFAATRQMMCCAVTGQGAGIAAAVSVKENVPCRKVDVTKVQKALKRQNVRIE
jgi:hypothetical protein